MIILWIALGISLIYFFLLLYYVRCWNKLPVLIVPTEYSPDQGVSIIIIAHNEANVIRNCLNGILHQNYPFQLMEIIVVDDHSTDNTELEIQGIKDDRIRLLHLSDFPEYIHAPAFKKSGITLAVDKARYEQILVTDADCTPPGDWLRTVMYTFRIANTKFLSAPVILSKGNSLLEKMQEMEQLILMVITGAGIQSHLHHLANGANMAFTKSVFKTVRGYEGNYQYASGDDMFLVEKISIQWPDSIAFCKSIPGTVFTAAKEDWPSLLQQRLRWAGKNKGLQNKSINQIWLFVGLYHVLLVFLFLAAFLPSVSWWPFLILLFVKWVADLMILIPATSFFNRKPLLKYFIPLQFLYTYYVLRLGWEMMLGEKTDWENR